jgi:hypothetical protein
MHNFKDFQGKNGVFPGAAIVLCRAYCRLVFNEDEQEARWNFEEYCVSEVNNSIETRQNCSSVLSYTFDIIA